MQRVTIKIPTIKSDQQGFRRLLGLVEQVLKEPYKYFDFDFSHCSRIDQHAVAVLGMLALYVDWCNSKANSALSRVLIPRAGVMFLVGTMADPVRKKLIENNFLATFSKEGFSGYPKGGYIGYRQHGKYLNPDEIANHLKNEWLTDEKLKLAPDLKVAVVSHILEVFTNAYGHGRGSEHSLGCVSCGQYDAKERRLNLTVVDFGCGVAESVRRYLRESRMSDVEALRWALKPGNSTRTDSEGLDIPRGLGFGLLAEFVGVNRGKIEIYTNHAHAEANSSGAYEVKPLALPFQGTMVDIDINCDGKRYSFYDSSKVNVKAYY